jgi:hypothetical protein
MHLSVRNSGGQRGNCVTENFRSVVFVGLLFLYAATGMHRLLKMGVDHAGKPGPLHHLHRASGGAREGLLDRVDQGSFKLTETG